MVARAGGDIQAANVVGKGTVRPPKLNITTFYGVIRFDATGANTYKPMATIQIQRGQVVTVFPRAVANGQLVYPTPSFGSR